MPLLRQAMPSYITILMRVLLLTFHAPFSSRHVFHIRRADYISHMMPLLTFRLPFYSLFFASSVRQRAAMLPYSPLVCRYDIFAMLEISNMLLPSATPYYDILFRCHVYAERTDYAPYRRKMLPSHDIIHRRR